MTVLLGTDVVEASVAAVKMSVEILSISHLIGTFAPIEGLYANTHMHITDIQSANLA